MTPFENGNTVTSVYGNRKYTYKGKTISEFHYGIDVTNKNVQGVVTNGNRVREVTGGTVVRVYSDTARGNVVEVQTSATTIERYQHFASVSVKIGQILKQGDLIGIAGMTGMSTGVHLHFEVLVNGKTVEPSAWLGLPNKAGVYIGNNYTDNSPSQNDHPLLKIPDSAPAVYQGISVVNNLNVRTAPNKNATNASYPKLNYLNTFDVLGESDGWLKIRINNNNVLHVGYVSASFTGVNDNIEAFNAKATTRIIVRTAPTQKSDELADWNRLNKDNEFVVIGDAGNWYKIIIQSKFVGFVSKQYVTKI